ncbi:virulence factor TspB C-terminal domain-related protein [Acinetobacter seifertii]|uniref:virulence factor TspB C-terminal domain-related protein n=1 Tax=Acinetobacter seifertii TaxID=1530123 RepID=UPI003D2C6825
MSSGFFQASPQCPPDVSLALSGLGSYSFSYDSFCNALQIAGYFVMIAAYLFAALIVSRA